MAFSCFLPGARLGNHWAFPVKMKPPDHIACCTLTYIWSSGGTASNVTTTRPAFFPPLNRNGLLCFQSAVDEEARQVHYLSVVCNYDQLHVLGCLLRMPFVLRVKTEVMHVRKCLEICWNNLLSTISISGCLSLISTGKYHAIEVPSPPFGAAVKALRWTPSKSFSGLVQQFGKYTCQEQSERIYHSFILYLSSFNHITPTKSNKMCFLKVIFLYVLKG